MEKGAWLISLRLYENPLWRKGLSWPHIVVWSGCLEKQLFQKLRPVGLLGTLVWLLVRRNFALEHLMHTLLSRTSQIIAWRLLIHRATLRGLPVNDRALEGRHHCAYLDILVRHVGAHLLLTSTELRQSLYVSIIVLIDFDFYLSEGRQVIQVVVFFLFHDCCQFVSTFVVLFTRKVFTKKTLILVSLHLQPTVTTKNSRFHYY